MADKAVDKPAVVKMRNPAWLLLFYLAFYCYIGGIFDVWDDVVEALYVVDTNGLSFTFLAVAQCSSLIPWCLRMIIAYPSDRYSLLGLGYRRPYVALGCAMAGAMCLCIRELDLKTAFGGYVMLMFVRNIGIALADSASDGMSVDADNEAMSGAFSAWMGIGRTLGQLITFLISGAVLNTGTTRRRPVPDVPGEPDEISISLAAYHLFLLILGITALGFVPFNFMLKEERVPPGQQRFPGEKIAKPALPDTPTVVSPNPARAALTDRDLTTTGSSQSMTFDDEEPARPIVTGADVDEAVAMDRAARIQQAMGAQPAPSANPMRDVQVEVGDAAPQTPSKAEQYKRKSSFATLADNAAAANRDGPKLVMVTRVGAVVVPQTVTADARPRKRERKFSFANLAAMWKSDEQLDAAPAAGAVVLSPLRKPKGEGDALSPTSPGMGSPGGDTDWKPRPRRRSFTEMANDSWRYFYADLRKIRAFVWNIRVMTLIFFVFLSNYGANMATFPTASWMQNKFGLSPDILSNISVVGNVGGLVASAICGYAFDWFGPSMKVLSLSIVSSCLGGSYMLLLLAQNSAQLYLLSFCYIGWWGALFCVQTAMIRILADQNLSATAFGIVLGVMNLAAMTGTLSAGPISDVLGEEAAFLIGGIFCCAAALLPPIILIPSSVWVYLGCVRKGIAGTATTAAAVEDA